jgi:heat shock transcription factor
VPHLQSGVLKNEAPSELWEFVNPYFKRNQPDLLSRVTRKNNRGPNPIPTSATSSNGTRQSARQAATTNTVLTSPGGRPIHLITDGTTEGEAGQLVGPTGQNLDLSAIASNIAAIRQAQTTLTADLQALKASNDHLWREALETREKHRTHEETMGLIISFLERLFGTEGEGLKGLKEALRRAGISGPSKREDSGMEEPGSQKKRKRLGPERMISHGPGDEKANGHLEEIGMSAFDLLSVDADK